MAFNQPFPLAQQLQQAKLSTPVYAPDLAVRLICPECKDEHPSIREEFSSGDLVCGTCGLVLGDRVVDTRSEWRTFANDEGDDPSRVGAASDPLLDGIDQLETAISFRDNNTGIARELQRASARAGDSRNKNLLSALKEIASLCDQFSLPKTISDIAKQLYKRADEEKLLRNKPTDATIAACIFIACRQAHVPRSFKEICNITNVPKKTLGQCYKALEQAFNIPTSRGKDGPEDMLVRLCNHLDLPARVQPICRDVIMAAREHGVADGRSPTSIAGGAIWFACLLLDVPKKIQDIGAVTGVSEGTIRIVYKFFYAAREKLVKQEWIDEGKAKIERLVAVDKENKSLASE